MRINFVTKKSYKVTLINNMSSPVITKKSVINDVYNIALLTAGAVTVSMVSKKLTKDPLGVQPTLTGVLKLSVALGLSSAIVKMSQEKGWIPYVIDK